MKSPLHLHSKPEPAPTPTACSHGALSPLWIPASSFMNEVLEFAGFLCKDCGKFLGPGHQPTISS